MSPIVKNKKTDKIEKDDVYVGRPTKWGNPYSHSENTRAQYKTETRREAVEKYFDYLLSRPDLLADIDELHGKNLVCWCAPKLCHADVLLRFANDLNLVKKVLQTFILTKGKE